ncbi:MAG: hypothetical protein LE178_03265 [Endomicrobium sp.]|nr:hypothetical protein [Endomicrobium sp.]
MNRIIVYILLLLIFYYPVFGFDNDAVLSPDEQSLKEINEICAQLDTDCSKKEKIRLLELLADKSITATQYHSALDAYSKLLDLKGNSKRKKFQYYVGLGNAYALKGNYILSIQNYRNAISLCRKNIDVKIKVGNIFLKSNLYELAEESFRDALSINNNSDEAKKGLGDVFYELGVYIKAVDYYTKTDLSAYNKETVVKVVDCYRNLDRIDDAVNFLEMATVGNKDKELIFLLATFYVDKKEYVKAKKLLLRLIEEDAKNFKLYIYLGHLYELTGDFVHAKKILDRASSLNSSYATTDLLQARIAYKTGNLLESKKYARNAYSKATIFFVKNQAQKMLQFLDNK